ncbi:MAG: ABC transporter ATP-binding protein [Candidatus Bathyarchaeia archaeon]
MVSITLDHVTKLYKGNIRAVDDISIEISEGLVVALLGPSGCGKTTTLRLIAGLEKPTNGKIYFDNLDVTKKDPKERNVAMVFQFPLLYSSISVYENIALPLKAGKVPSTHVRKEVTRIADLLGIRDYLDYKPEKLDMGARQKVTIAKAIVRNPSVFLFDEPLTVVDPKTRVELRKTIKEIQMSLGRSMIYVTHDQTEALTLSDRIAVMNNGKILQYGTPDEIYSRPKTSFVGMFVGNPGMNLIECSLHESDGKLIITTEGGFQYDVSFLKSDIDRSRKKVLLGIRPEDIQISRDDKGIKALCRHVVSVGNRAILHLDVYDRKVKAKVPIGTPISPGDIVLINIDNEKIKLFDAESGMLMTP